MLLKFISKNLYWGVFSKTVLNLHDKGAVDEDSVYDLFIRGIEENNIKESLKTIDKKAIKSLPEKKEEKFVENKTFASITTEIY